MLTITPNAGRLIKSIARHRPPHGAIDYVILQTLIIKAQGRTSKPAQAIAADKLSSVLYVLGIDVFFYRPWIAGYIHTLVALIWLVPDRRLERAVKADL